MWMRMEKCVKESKLKCEVADKLIRQLKKHNFSVEVILEIVFVNEARVLEFITIEYLKTRNQDYHKIFKVFSVMYDKIRLLNINAPECTDVMVEFLIDYEYNRDINGGRIKSKIRKMDDKKRLDIINECVDIILTISEPEDYYQCDDMFMFLLRSVCKHLCLLSPKEKKKLKDVDNIEHCLNVFYLIQKDQLNDITKLILNKLFIMRVLGKLQIMLRNTNKDLNTKLLESYFEVTENEINLPGHRKKVELSWRSKTEITLSELSFGELMKRLKDILEFKIMTEVELKEVKSRVERKLANYNQKNSANKMQICETKVNLSSNPDDLRTMLEVYFETSNCGSKRNPITKYILSVHERAISSPFDEIALKVKLLLEGRSPLSSEIEIIRNKIKSQLRKPPKYKWHGNITDKIFFKQLERHSSILRNFESLSNICYHIAVVDNVDMHECSITGPLAIRRTLHIIGEFTKFTAATKSISAKMSAFLNSLHNSLSNEIMQQIRNRLSHNYSFNRLLHFENLQPEDCKKFQDELKSLKHIFLRLLNIQTNEVLKQFHNTVYNCRNEDELQSLLDYIGDIEEIKIYKVDHNEQIINICHELKNNIMPQLSSIEEGTLPPFQFSEYFLSKYLNLAYICTDGFEYKMSMKYLKDTMYYNSLKEAKRSFRVLVAPNFGFTIGLKYPCEIRLLSWALVTIKSSLRNPKYAEYKFLADSIETISLKIQDNFEHLLHINVMNEILNDVDEHNPVMELEVLSFLNNVYSETGLTEVKLQEHENYNQAFNEMMLALNKNTSISQIKAKYSALEKYFESLDQEVSTSLKIFKKNEEQTAQKILNDKISLLGTIPMTDPFSKIALEMLLLEILEIMNDIILQDNLHQLDDEAPVLCGRNLRNFLGHKKDKYAVIVQDFNQLYKNVLVINKRINQFKLFDECEPSTEDTTEELFIERSNFDDELEIMDVQNRLYESIQQLNLSEFQDALRDGAVVQGRNYRNQNVLDICISYNFEVFEQYAVNKNLLSTSDLEFIETFLDVIPPELFLFVEFTEDEFPKHVFEQTKPSMANGDRKHLETVLLPYACSIGALETVKLISQSEENYDLNRSDSEGYTPLMYACLTRSTDIISVLLARIGTIILTEDLTDCLHVTNDLSIFKLIIPKCRNVNQTSKNNLLLFCVYSQCSQEIIQFLIDEGADINYRLPTGDSIADYAMCYRIDLFQYMMLKGATFDNSLELVCTSGDIKMVKFLLKSKIEFKNIEQCFHNALINNFTEIFELLLKHHSNEFKNYSRLLLMDFLWIAIGLKNYKLIGVLFANIEFQMDEFNIILIWGITSNDCQTVSSIYHYGRAHQLVIEKHSAVRILPLIVQSGNLELVQKLIELGFDYTRSYELLKGCTILHFSVIKPFNNKKTLQYLLTLKECNLNATNKQGYTASSVTVQSRNILHSYILLKNGADVNIASNEGITLLHFACLNGDLEMIKLLVRFGVAPQISRKTDNNISPLEMALSAEHYHLIPYLRKLQLVHDLMVVSNTHIRFIIYCLKHLIAPISLH